MALAALGLRADELGAAALVQINSALGGSLPLLIRRPVFVFTSHKSPKVALTTAGGSWMTCLQACAERGTFVWLLPTFFSHAVDLGGISCGKIGKQTIQRSLVGALQTFMRHTAVSLFNLEEYRPRKQGGWLFLQIKAHSSKAKYFEDNVQ